MGTPIKFEDIRKGDRVREITRTVKERTSDYTAGCDRQTLDRYGSGDKSWELLDRPKKVKYAKGTELWLTTRYFPWSKDDRIVLRENWYEDDFEGKVVYPGKNYIISEYAVTDVKPEPHPVGAIRWVTEDCKSRWGVPLPKGQRLVVERNHYDNTPAGDVLVTGFEEKRIFVAARFLSATLVEPAHPTVADVALVAVPLPAIEKLRDENDRAYDVFGQDAKKNSIRRNAIDHFLNNTREVKTALRGDEW